MPLPSAPSQIVIIEGTTPPPLPAVPPSPPSGLAVVAGDTQVTLTWSAVAGAASYTVKRALLSGGPYSVVRSGLTETNFLDTGLVNDTTYYYVVLSVNAAGASVPSMSIPATPFVIVPPGGDPNAYFTALVARPETWKSWSLRNDAQVVALRATQSAPAAVRYLYPTDPYPLKQDGAKVVIPPFLFQTTLTATITPTATTLTLGNSTYVVGRHLKIDSEILKITAHTAGSTTYTVQRGFFSTTPADHLAATSVGVSTNSLPNMVWLPLGGTNDHQYLFIWDAWFGPEFAVSQGSGLATYKNFQVDAAGVWFETRTRFSLATGTDIGKVDARGNGTLGPNVTLDQPLSPSVGTFTIKPATWTRYFVHVDMRSTDWELNSLWVADETHDPVQIIDRRQMENYGQMARFRFEYNTSQDALGANRGDLTGYIRNFWAGRDVPFASVPAYFARPVG